MLGLNLAAILGAVLYQIAAVLAGFQGGTWLANCWPIKGRYLVLDLFLAAVLAAVLYQSDRGLQAILLHQIQPIQGGFKVVSKRHLAASFGLVLA